MRISPLFCQRESSSSCCVRSMITLTPSCCVCFSDVSTALARQGWPVRVHCYDVPASPRFSKHEDGVSPFAAFLKIYSYPIFHWFSMGFPRFSQVFRKLQSHLLTPTWGTSWNRPFLILRLGRRGQHHHLWAGGPGSRQQRHRANAARLGWIFSRDFRWWYYDHRNSNRYSYIGEQIIYM